MKNVKKIQGPPEIAPEPSPTITPEMVRNVLEILESKGMIHYTAGGAYIPTESGWKLLMEIKPVKEEIIGYGSKDVKASSTSEIKITKASKVEEGTICINADKACKDLSKEFKNAIKSNVKIEILIEAGGESDVVIAYGSPAFKPKSREEIIIRKNSIIDGKTIGILANKSACELKQSLIEKLKNPETKVKITLEVKY